MCRFTAISENSRQKNLKPMEYPRSILSAEDSRAKMLAQQVKELVSLIVKGTLPDPAFGESMPGLFASLNQDGLWLKTWQGYCQSLLPDFGEEDSELFCETWPKWGIVLDGHAMELPMLERRIKDKECSLWPTVTTDTSDRKKKYSQGGTPLTLAVKKNWPTPRGNKIGGSTSDGYGLSLNEAVNGGRRNNWPTPKAHKGQLNADWVELLMGLPIGWTDIDIAYEDIGSWPGWPAAINVEQYAYEPPRVIVGQKNRAKRLKALGNGCVPQQIYLVFAAIKEMNK